MTNQYKLKLLFPMFIQIMMVEQRPFVLCPKTKTYS